MFQKNQAVAHKNVFEKIQMKSLTHGEKTHLVEFKLEKGAVIPEHSHPHEQIGYMVSGEMNISIGGRTHPAKSGDSWCIAGDVEHGVEVLEDSVVVEVFSPVRDDYLS